MKALSRYFLPLLLASAVVLTSAAAREHGHDGPPDKADGEDHESSGSTAKVKFSDPSKPGTLKLSLPWAEARVTATDANEVVVTSTLDQKGHRELDHEGFRRIDEDMTFELVEKNNVATIVIGGESSWIPQGAEFDIQVPRNTNLILRTEAGGDISVTGIDGDIDIQSMNGEVNLSEISSSAVVNTMNGEIHAEFRKAPVKPVSLSSMNGEIDLRLPGDSKANLRMRTHNGSIRTNFTEGALQTKTEKVTGHVSADSRTAEREAKLQAERDLARAERDQAKASREVARAQAAAPQAVVMDSPSAVLVHDGDTLVAPVAPVAPIPPMPNFGGKSIVGTLNGGGVDIKLTSMNGTITLRESK